MSLSWHSYPSIFHVGHAALAGFFDDDVVVQEKVDGSQFSFGIFDGELKARSKGAVLNLCAPERMFERAVESVRAVAGKLVDGWTYRGEYLAKPKHNALAYDRVPNGHIVLFDINTSHEGYADRTTLETAANLLGFDCIPELFRGRISKPEDLRALLDRESYLGGQKIEGVVCKQATVTRFGQDKKALIAKFVSEAFKEVHGREWKAANPSRGDFLEELCERYRTPARWQKAALRLRESGQATGGPKDIGPMMKLVPPDIEKECREEIMEALWKWAWPQIARKSTHGLPEWWKEQLLKEQFAEEVQS